MAILYLILGHLAGDFLLQPNILIKWKQKSPQGMLFHVLVHFLVNFVLLLPFLTDISVILGLFTLSAAHFVIDSVKIQKEAAGRRFRRYFLIDQMSHLLAIFGVGYLIKDFVPVAFSGSPVNAFYQNVYVIAGLSLLIIVTYSVEIFFHQKIREKVRGAPFKPNYSCMFKRALIFSALYAIFMIFGVCGIASGF
jgi:hypothetical protein